MKNILAIMLFGFCFCNSGNAQELPLASLTNLQGQYFETSNFNQKDSVVKVLSFWATWCLPCINELSTISDLESIWKKELKYELYAIAEDDSRTAKKVPSLVNGRGWEFTVLLDKNQDYKRLLNLPILPYTIVVKNGRIIYRHQGYAEGDEKELYKIIKDNQ